MLLLFWILLLVTGACLVLLMPALWSKKIYNTYHDPRRVQCPETHAQVSVRFDALRAAITGLVGESRYRLADCSRWPERADCNQACIPDALRSRPAIVDPAVPQPRTNRISHLPVLIAAAAAWVLGMAWHSEYLFRPQWMAALGLSDRQTRDLAEMWAPHLLTVGLCLFFAYGVAWVMLWLGARSLFLGIRVAVSLWLLMVAIVLAITRTPIHSDLVWIEGIYSFFGALLIGAIVGGVPRRIFLKD